MSRGVHRRCAAHPRSRGENLRRSAVEALATGSSPLTRGKRRPRVRSNPPSRLIPAHAGKTLRPHLSAAAAAAHPRSRGENITVALGVISGVGSSPLTRGKHDEHTRGREDPRLIPAHAGKTYGTPLSPIFQAAHPRSRGENRFVAVVRTVLEGSSPLTRGKQLAGRHLRTATRLIPAHAGKTRSWGLTQFGHEAHPRSRRENELAYQIGELYWGSSPLTRGELLGRDRDRSQLRLTPTHAGKTSRRAGSP